MKKKAFNKMIYGIVAGIIVPLLMLSLIVFFRRGGTPFLEYLSSLHSVNILSKLISICLLPNLLVFFGFLWTHNDKAARGVIFSLFFFAGFFIVLKII